MTKPLHNMARLMHDSRTFTVKGRDAWALIELLIVGTIGVTSIDNSDPKWSGYVFNLKRNHDFNIETRYEAHRYVLLSAMSRSDMAELEAA